MNNLAIKYGAGFTEAPSADYPTGGFKNEVTPGVFNGTPYEKGWADDLNAFMQGLIKAAGITVSGNTDTVPVSQILQGLVHQVTTADFMVDSGAADDYVLAPLTDNYAIDSYEDNMRLRFIPDNTNIGASTVDVSGVGAVDIVDAQGTALTGGELVAGDTVTLQYDSGLSDFIIAASTSISPGRTIQKVNVTDGAVNTGTTVIPRDNSTPQNTEGDEYMTLAITPTNASNFLDIDIVVHLAHSAATDGEMIATLFQDATAGALGVGWSAKRGAANNLSCVVFSHRMVAGTTSLTIFKIRAGANSAGTTTFNGVSAAVLFGGVLSSSITITETKA